MINNQRLLDTFLTLVCINGPSGNEAKVAEYIKQSLTELEIPWQEDRAGSTFGGNSGNIIATLEGINNLPEIFLCSHMDTIQPTLRLNPTIGKDGTIASDGTTILGADDRAGIAIILEIVRTIKENAIDTLPINLIFTVAEEIGMFGSKYLSVGKINSKIGFVFDSSADPGKIITTAPAAVKVKIKIKGKAAHAAVQPEQGINAITIACNAIAKMKVGRISNTCTVNFGVIKGGTLINVIPEEVEIDGEIRSLLEPELLDQINLMQSIFEETTKQGGGKLEFLITRKYYSFNLAEDNDVVVIAKNAIEKTGSVPVSIKYTGGSDANVFNALGIPTVNLGIGFRNVHSDSEFIPSSNLLKAACIGLEIVNSSLEFYTAVNGNINSKNFKCNNQSF